MKKTFLLLPLAVVIGFGLFINASHGVANIDQKDRTGAPGSSANCSACHNSGISFSTVPSIVVTENSNIITAYEPLKKYTVTVDIQSSGNIAHGFQITGLLDDNTFGGLVESVNDGQKIVLNDKWYFENSKNETGGSYSMNWIAPPAGSGNVTFYGSALATNGDGKTSGDDYENIPNLVLAESTATGVNTITKEFTVNVYPNPAMSFITIQGSKTLRLLGVFNMEGKEVIAINTSSKKHTVDISMLANGAYMVRVEDSSVLQRISFIKQ